MTLIILLLAGVILLLALGAQKAPPVHLVRMSSLIRISTEQAVLSGADPPPAGSLAGYKSALMVQHLSRFHHPFVQVRYK